MGNAVEPAVRIGAVAARVDLREVDHCSELICAAERSDGAAHQTGFTDGAGAEHEAETLCSNAGLEHMIGGAFYVARALGLHRAADDEELTSLNDLGHGAGL